MMRATPVINLVIVAIVVIDSVDLVIVIIFIIIIMMIIRMLLEPTTYSSTAIALTTELTKLPTNHATVP